MVDTQNRRLINGKAIVPFKLNVFDKDEKRILDVLEPLRSKRKQSEFIRKALLAYIRKPKQKKVETSENSELLTKFNRFLALVEAGQLVVGKPVQGEPVQIRGSDIALPPPVFEDEDVIVIKRDKSAGEASAMNFLNSMLGIQDVEEAENTTQTRPMRAITNSGA